MLRSLVQYVAALEKRPEQCGVEHGGIGTEYLGLRPDRLVEEEPLVLSDAEEDNEEQMETFRVNQSSASMSEQHRPQNWPTKICPTVCLSPKVTMLVMGRKLQSRNMVAVEPSEAGLGEKLHIL